MRLAHKNLLRLVFTLCVFNFGNTYAQKIITSFEDESEMKNITASQGVLFAQSTDFPAVRKHSCKIDFPDTGGEFQYLVRKTKSYLLIEETTTTVNDEVLLLYVWALENSSVNIIVKDKSENAYTENITLKAGSNHIQLVLKHMKGLDLTKINSIVIQSDIKQTIYVDYYAFDTFQAALENLGKWDVTYAVEIETPHYPWAKDYAKGTINTFSISPVMDGRGIVELAQRLDIDMNVTTIGRRKGTERYGFGDFYKRRVQGHGDDSAYNLANNYILDNLLYDEKMDVIIWPAIHTWDNYSKQVQNAVLEKVKNGTGLVLIYPVGNEENSSIWDISPLKSLKASERTNNMKNKDVSAWLSKSLDKSIWSQATPHYITNGIGLDVFPWGHIGVIPYENNGGDVLLKTDEGNPVIAVKNYGKGRVVALAYPQVGLLPEMKNPWATGLNYPYWEYMWSLVSRSVVWASANESDAAIQLVSRTKKGLDVTLNQLTKDATLNIQVTDAFNVIEEDLSIDVKANQEKVGVALQNLLSEGKHIVKLQLKGNKGVYDWSTFVFETEKFAKITAVKNDKLELPVGDVLQTTVTINSEKKIKGALEIALLDNYNRLVDKKIITITSKGEQTFDVSFNSKNVITNLAKVDVSLIVKEKNVDRKVEEVFFYQPRLWDDYDVTMYHFGPNPMPGVWSGIDQQLRELDVTTLAAYTLDNTKQANYKVQAQTRIQGVESPDDGPDLEYYKTMVKNYLKTKDKYLLVRKYGLNDTVYLNSVRDDLTEQIKAWKKFSPSAYYIYEEPSVTKYASALDLDFSEISLMAMRDWLKTQYDSLEALNKQWGTNFKDWESVVPDDSFEARVRGNYSSWGDHRTFMEVTWANQFKFVQDIVNEVDPGGLVQLSGTQAASSHNGYDYSRINPYVGQMNPYNIDNQLEYHLAFNPKLKISGRAGYGDMGKKVVYDYYNNIFLNETGGSYVFWQASSMNPDFTLTKSGTDMKEGFDELSKGGIGRLIANYKPDNELKIAIHYSQPSIHGAWIADGVIKQGGYDSASETLKMYNKNRDGWVKSLHDMGFAFEFIAYSKVETGDLISKGYKVFILPMSYALSDKEVKEIKEFVNQGGVLIADALPGIMDDHTMLRKNRALADVFGIKAKKYNRDEMTLPKGESDLKITTAKVLLKEKGGSKILVNHYGKGSAYLLNYFMDNYPEEKREQTNGTSLEKLRTLFNNEKIASSINVTKLDGAPEKGIEKYVFAEGDGTTQIVGMLPGKQGKDREVVLHIENPKHLYNIRSKQYLGKAKEFKIQVKNTTPELFGLTENKIETFDVSVPSQITAGDEITLDINFKGEGSSNFTSVAVIDVINPKGERINYYSKNADIKDGTGSFGFTTAKNEMIGEWKIKITEVISGIEKEAIVKIK